MQQTLTLAQAIREGATLRLQGFGAWFQVDSEGRIKSDALGAAYEAIFGLPDGVATMPSVTLGSRCASKLYTPFPELIHREGLACPECKEHKSGLYEAICHLNDNHFFTREAIADWVDTLPRVQPALVQIIPVMPALQLAEAL